MRTWTDIGFLVVDGRAGKVNQFDVVFRIKHYVARADIGLVNPHPVEILKSFDHLLGLFDNFARAWFLNSQSLSKRLLESFQDDSAI